MRINLNRYGVLRLVSVTLTLFVLLVYSFTPRDIIFAYTEVSQNYIENNVGQNKTYNGDLKVKILADGIEGRLKDAAAILEITGNLDVVKSTSNATLLNTTSSINGIPENDDIEKRRLAKNILSNFDVFEVIFFLMPNGDMYMEEPYMAQENLTNSNFGFRGYFQGAVNTGMAYLGDVIISAASGLPQAEIAVPLYFPNNDSLVGVWTGAIDFDLFQEGLQSLNLTHNERVIYVDNNGTKIADSDKDLLTTSESFSNLKSFKNAMIGQSGSIVEIVNGMKMFVSYQPIRALQNTWVVLWMQTASNII